MKKITILAAAAAMFAFASCNKEENRVALNFGGEEYTSAEKQAYESNAILFTSGEQMYVNGVLCDIIPLGTGRNARVWCTGADEYMANYGDVVIAEDGTVTTTFKSRVNLIPMEGNTVLGADQQPWPMSGYTTDATEPFKLLHNVALLAPAVKYGAIFAEQMWGENGVDPQNVTIDADNLPVVVIDSVILSSTDIQLTGEATLTGAQTTRPRMVMNGAASMNNPSSIVCNIPGGFTANVSTTDGAIGDRFGLVSIAPVNSSDADKHIKADFYFHTTINGFVLEYKYSGNITLNDNVEVQRASRLTLLADLYSRRQITDLQAKITRMNADAK